jgi:M6 family metalloprotease-like protein
MHKRSPGWDNGNIVHLWSCEAGPRENKYWTFEPATGLIRSTVNPAMCMHKKFRGWENGNPIHLWRCDAGAPEMKTWVFDRSTDQIASAVNPDVCMHKRSPGFENGNIIHLWDCAAGGRENTAWAVDDGLHVAGLTRPDDPANLRRFGFDVLNPGPSHPLLVILAEFQDARFRDPHGFAFYDRWIFARGIPAGLPRARTLVGYFRENSYGRFTMARAGVIPVMFASTRACAFGDGNACPGTPFEDGKMQRSQAIRLAAAQGGFDFAAFDRNGDGIVLPQELSILIISAGPAPSVGGQTGPGEPTCQRVHSSPDTPVRVCGRVSSVNEGASLLTMIHEVTHLFGARDLYLGGFSQNFKYTAMAATVSGAESVRDVVHFDPWYKMAFGWQAPLVFDTRGTGTCVSIDAAQVSGLRSRNLPIILHDPDRGSDEFFLVEYRRRSAGSADANMADPVGGLAIWNAHVMPNGNLEGVRRFRAPIRTPNGTATNGWKWIEAAQLSVWGAPNRLFGGGRLWRASDGAVELEWSDGSSANVTVMVGPVPDVGDPLDVVFYRGPHRPSGRITDPNVRGCLNRVYGAHR